MLLILDFDAADYDQGKILRLKHSVMRLYAGQDAAQDVLYVTVEKISLI